MRFDSFLKSVAQTIEVCVLLAMTVLLPAAPLASTLLSGDARHLRQYRSTLGVCLRMVGALWRTHVVARNAERVLRTLLGAPHEAERIEGACTHCGRCCIDKSCVFLTWDEAGHSRCSIYNNWFWKLTSCGTYPVNAHSIAVYGCPSFRAVPIRVVPAAQTKTPRGPAPR